MANVVLETVTKRFGDVTALDALSLDIPDAEFLVLLGPSGCGKSTALRMVAGLDDPTSGTIAIGERTVNDVLPKDRDVAMVFQSYALYPHLSVAKNIEFPLRSRGVPREERAERVREVAATLGLEALLDRKPAQLSGGQRQRVALGRAIVRRPEVFLMDEPLSNLDAALRVQTRADIVELQRRLGVTTLYVTHDQVEAMTMGHRIAVLSEGRLQQIANPQVLYSVPANTFVARFIGSPGMNLFAGRLHPDGQAGDAAVPGPEVARIQVAGGWVRAPRVPRAFTPSADGSREGALTVGIRPEHLRIDDGDELKAEVTIVELLGAETHVICKLDDGTTIVVRQTGDRPIPRAGESVAIAADPDTVHLFDPDSGRRLDTEPPVS